MPKIGIEQGMFRGRPIWKKCTGLVARRRVMGGGKRGVGRKEESKKERKKGKFEDLKNGEVFYTP